MLCLATACHNMLDAQAELDMATKAAQQCDRIVQFESAMTTSAAERTMLQEQASRPLESKLA